jgi:hypothetical protein
VESEEEKDVFEMDRALQVMAYENQNLTLEKLRMNMMAAERRIEGKRYPGEREPVVQSAQVTRARPAPPPDDWERMATVVATAVVTALHGSGHGGGGRKGGKKGRKVIRNKAGRSVCFDFYDHKKCEFGDECRFSHDLD